MCLSVTDLPYLHMHMCAGERVLPASIVYPDQPKCLHAHNLCNVCTCVSQWCPLVRVSLGILVCVLSLGWSHWVWPHFIVVSLSTEITRKSGLMVTGPLPCAPSCEF